MSPLLEGELSRRRHITETAAGYNFDAVANFIADLRCMTHNGIGYNAAVDFNINHLFV